MAMNISDYLQGIYNAQKPATTGQGAPSGTGNGFQGGLLGHITNFLFGSGGAGSASSPDANAQGAGAGTTTQTPASNSPTAQPTTGQGATVPGGSGTGSSAGGTAPLGTGPAAGGTTTTPKAPSPTTTTSPATPAPSQADQIASLIGPKPSVFNPSDASTAEGKDINAFKTNTTNAYETSATAQKTLNEQNRQNEIETLQANHTDQIAALRNKIAMGGGGPGNFGTAGAGLLQRAQYLNDKIVDATNTKYDINNLNIDANTKKEILDAVEAHIKDLRDNYTANTDAAEKYSSNVIGEQNAMTEKERAETEKSIAPSQIAQNYASARKSQADAAWQEILNSGGQNIGSATKTYDLDSGSKFVDLSNIPSGDLKTAAYLTAQKQGLPVLDGKQATDMNQTIVAKLQMASVSNAIKNLGGNLDPASADYQKYIGQPLSNVFQTNPKLGSYDNFKTAAFDIIQGLAVGGSANANKTLIKEAEDRFPQATDPIGTAMQKINDINSMLTNVQTGIIQGASAGDTGGGQITTAPDGTQVLITN